MKKISILVVLATSSLVAACGSDADSSASLPSPSVGPPATTVPTPVGSTAIEPPPATADAPGDVAVWKLESATDVVASSTTFTALVNRLGCSGGVTGEVLKPTVEMGETDIVVTFFVAALDSDLEQTCPDNDEVPYEVILDEPIGERPLLDGSCRSGGEAASTSFCAAGAARWIP